MSPSLHFIPQKVPEVILIQPAVYHDERGYFVETFRQDRLERGLGYSVNFCQDNESQSAYGVLRGLHFQLPPYEQAKLVRVIAGEVLDVAVDIRPKSATFGQHVAVVLNAQNKHQLFIPKGFAHGFVALSETAITAYKTDAYYAPEQERGLAYNDPRLNINWQLPSNQLKLSQKDQNYPGLADLDKDLFYR